MRETLAALSASLARALIFGAVNLLCLIGDAMLRRHEVTHKFLFAFALFSAGAAVACFVAWPLAGRLARGKPASAELAAMLATLMAATACFAALFFFMQTRLYYAPYYPAEATMEYLFHFLYTAAAAFYQVGVLGVRYFLPLGLVPLFAAAFLFTAERRAIVKRGPL